MHLLKCTMLANPKTPQSATFNECIRGIVGYKTPDDESIAPLWRSEAAPRSVRRMRTVLIGGIQVEGISLHVPFLGIKVVVVLFERFHGFLDV